MRLDQCSLDPLPRIADLRRMLRGISPLLGPELLTMLYRMGHGDELVLADAFFPGESCGQRVVRADGHHIAALLDGILPLISLDKHQSAPAIMMAPVAGDQPNPTIKAAYLQVITRHHGWLQSIDEIDRGAFYQRAAQAFAVVMTGETARYGNLIIRRGNDDL